MPSYQGAEEEEDEVEDLIAGGYRVATEFLVGGLGLSDVSCVCKEDEDEDEELAEEDARINTFLQRCGFGSFLQLASVNPGPNLSVSIESIPGICGSGVGDREHITQRALEACGGK